MGRGVPAECGFRWPVTLGQQRSHSPFGEDAHPKGQDGRPVHVCGMLASHLSSKVHAWKEAPTVNAKAHVCRVCDAAHASGMALTPPVWLDNKTNRGTR
jgi:2-keto-3-deoxy-galactonokinase